MNKWYKLDNAAKIFPAITNKKNSSVFRISAVLNEPVDKNILQKTADHIYSRFPMMFLKMRKGVFWQYFENSPDKFFIQEEKDYPCGVIDPHQNDGYLIKILYYGSRISVEAYHALTDGGGATEFLKSILYYYFSFSGNQIADEGKVILIGDGISNENMEDSFAKNYELVKGYRKKSNDLKKAYQIKGTPFENHGHNIITGVLSAGEVNKLAKSKNATITSYLASVLAYSIYNAQQKYSPDKNPISIIVPVSLRKHFKSGTLRNFFAVVNINILIDDLTDFNFIAEEMTRELKTKTEENALLEVVANNLSLEKAICSRIVPLFLKKAFLLIGYNILSEAKSTMTLSNLGNISVPSGFLPRLNHLSMNLCNTSRTPLNCGVCSVNGRLAISFSSTVTETDIVKSFFTYLSETEKLNVEIYSNEWGSERE